MKALTLILLFAFVALSAPVVSADAIDPPNCYQVYTRYDVGTTSVVRRNSCAVPEVYQCPYQGAPISSCEHLLR